MNWRKLDVLGLVLMLLCVVLLIFADVSVICLVLPVMPSVGLRILLGFLFSAMFALAGSLCVAELVSTVKDAMPSHDEDNADNAGSESESDATKEDMTDYSETIMESQL